MKLKTYVLTISERFPSAHPKARNQTDFEASIAKRLKIHTLRGNYEYWKKRIDEVAAGRAILSVRQWVGRPRAKESFQKELFRFGKEDGVGIEKVYQYMDLFYLDNGMEHQISNTVLAKNDGLHLEDFNSWFPPVYERQMAIIHFTDFRYYKA